MRDLVIFVAGGITFIGFAALAFALAGRLLFPEGALFGAADSADSNGAPAIALERDRQTRILSAEDAARHASL